MPLTQIDKPVLSGASLLDLLKYDFKLTGSIIALQDDNWRELLKTIIPGHLQRNTAYIVWKVREAIGKDDFELARKIAQGE